MVHHVQAPQGWNGVMEDMLQVYGKIEGEHSHYYFEPVGKIDVIEKPPVTLIGQKRQRHRKKGENQADREGIEADHHKVCKPPARLGSGQGPARREDFTEGNQEKDPEEKPQTYRYFSAHEEKPRLLQFKF
jgi:hypothetical protein